VDRRTRQQARAARPERSGAQTAKVFWSGRSQAVRLPREFRFVTREVVIHRDGDRVILEPPTIERDAKGWPMARWQLAGAAPEFDLGDRAARHERADPLKPRR